MGIPSVFNTGRSGMMAAKAAIATTGHNISNANAEGFNRQRVQQSADAARNGIGNNLIGQGVHINRVERFNDEYIEKQIRNSNRDVSHLEEKDMALRQTEDVFNELGGDGLNRLMSKFFNEFRQLANDPNNEAIRQSVREASQALTNDFHRIHTEVDEVRKHIDAKLEGYVGEVNALSDQIKDLNLEIKKLEVSGASPNDLLDRRDLALKKLGSYLDLSMHKDADGAFIIDVKGVGPLVVGPQAEKFSVFRSKEDDQGKAEASLDIRTTASANGKVTHALKGGKLGALIEVRDQTLSTVLDRLDELAFNLTESVNDIHTQGFTRNGDQGVHYFKPIEDKARAAEFIDLSDAVKLSVNHIATAAQADAPSDNRIAIAISGLQGERLMSNGQTTMDDFFNSIVSDIGVAGSRTRQSMNQAKDIQTQLGKMREQLSGVSIDEETANLMQFQHAFDASARVVSVADEMLKTVLDLRR